MAVVTMGKRMMVTSNSPTAQAKKRQIVHFVREFLDLEGQTAWEKTRGRRWCTAICGKKFAWFPPDDRPKVVCAGCSKVLSAATIRVALQNVVEEPTRRPRTLEA